MKAKAFCLLVIISCLTCKSLSAQKWYWASQASGNTSQVGYSVAHDKMDNVYLSGVWSGNPGQAFSFGGNTITSNGPYDYPFLFKYDVFGNQLWARVAEGVPSHFHGAGAFSVCTDGNNDVYITGSYSDTIYFGNDTLTSNKGGGVFLVKYDPNGNLIWAKTSDGLSGGQGNGVTADNSNNIYITGSYSDTIQFGSYKLNNGSNTNAFIVKYDPSGNVVWAKTPVGPAESYGYGIASDKNSNIYITGEFMYDSLSFGSVILKNKGASDVYLVKYDVNGNVLWGTSAGGKAFDIGYSVATDTSNNLYITGLISNDTIAFGKDTLITNSFSSLFLAKYNSNGNVIWAKSSKEEAPGICVTTDMCNNVYISGELTIDTITINSFQLNTSENTGWDSYVAKFDSSGAPLCGVGLLYGNTGNGISVDGQGNILFGAGFEATATTDNSNIVFTPLSKGSLAGVVKFTCDESCCDTSLIPLLGKTSIVYGDSIEITPSTSGLSYYWSTGASTSSISVSPKVNSVYWVLININGECQRLGIIDITVNENCLFVPDAFSPNGDGKNDYLYVHGDCVKTMDFKIFDRWGNMIFESTDKNIPWNGTFKGEPMNTGTFVYYLEGTFYNGNTFTKKGNVSLIR
ncbi:MAG TPA: gliding motility-associated C-terminal domain-containing protein [Bacteroidia bacterium]|jgi:gliding motility-associated-like protein|nr:gliding motility-associated C-terminal domain-containing protein [Bacteroidia bacterium]